MCRIALELKKLFVTARKSKWFGKKEKKTTAYIPNHCPMCMLCLLTCVILGLTLNRQELVFQKYGAIDTCLLLVFLWFPAVTGTFLFSVIPICTGKKKKKKKKTCKFAKK